MLEFLKHFRTDEATISVFTYNKQAYLYLNMNLCPFVYIKTSIQVEWS